TGGDAVEGNLTTTPRTGTLTIAGQTFTVTQAGAPCTFTLDATSASPSAAAGSGTVGVTASAGSCTWTATSNAPTWLTVTSGSNGTGNGTVSYAVVGNLTTTPRTGTLTIAGQTFTVTQAGAPCTMTVDTTSARPDAPAGGGVGGGPVAVGSCTWTATSNAPTWLTVTAGSSGIGNGTVGYAVAANLTTTPRTGTLTIAGTSFEVAQSGAVTCTYVITPAT